MIYLMRHGQDDETYIGGWSEVRLIDEGIVQVKNAVLWIKENLDIRKIICSDVPRAIETATIVSDVLRLNYQTSKLLREQNKGLLNGMIKSKSLIEYPETCNPTIDYIYPKGESLKMLYDRVREFLKAIDNIEDKTLLITHRGFINMIYYILNNIELDMNKEQFDVTCASIHELDTNNKIIRKVW